MGEAEIHRFHARMVFFFIGDAVNVAHDVGGFGLQLFF